MRNRALFFGDIRFQWKYGFYFLYLVLTLLYLMILQLLPSAWKPKVAMLLVFSDPAAMGLFFMGAIIQLEKGAHTLQSLSVSPVRSHEYVLSKLFSLGLLATLVALCLATAGKLLDHPMHFILVVFAGSCIFSSIGMMIATKTETLNQFIVATIPMELVINLPAVAYVLGYNHPLMLLHPGCCIMELIMFGERIFLASLILSLWAIALFLLTIHVVEGFFSTLGGAKK